MELSIISETNNPLLARKEVEAKISFEGATPNRKDVQKEVAAKLKAKENMIIIDSINTAFGQTNATFSARIYSDEKVMQATERKNLIEKHSGHGEEPAPAEEAPATQEAPKEEASEESAPVAEEKAEEAPAEEEKKEEAAE